MQGPDWTHSPDSTPEMACSGPMANKKDSWSWKQFQIFVKVMTASQKTGVKIFSNTLLYVNLLIFIVVYLVETATHREPFNGSFKYIMLVFDALSGIQTTAVLFLGTSYLFPTRTWWVVLLDFSVWVLLVATASLILGADHDDTGEDDSERTMISVNGLVLVVRLLTFLAFNQSIGAVHLERDVNTGTGGVVGVPLTIVSKLISESGLSDDSIVVLHDDLREADKNNDGVLDCQEFFYFKFGSTKRNVGWNMPWFTNRAEYKTLLDDKLTFYSLIPEQDLICVKRNLGDDVGLAEAVFTAAKLLVHSQRWMGAFVFLDLVVGAISEIGFVILTGLQVNVAVDLATNGDEHGNVRQQFMDGIAGLVVLWFVNEITWRIACVCGARLIANATGRIQLGFAESALYGGKAFEERYNAGTLSNAFSSSLAKTEEVWYQLIFYFTRPVATFISAVGFLAVFDVSYALFVVSTIPIIASFRFLELKATYWSDKADASEARLLSLFQNLIHVRPAAQVCNSQSFVLGRFKDKLKEATRNNFRKHTWSNDVQAEFAFVGNALYMITTVVFLFELADGHLNAGEFFALAGIVTAVIYPIDHIGAFSGVVAKQSGAIQKVYTVLSEGQQSNSNDEGASAPSQVPSLSLDDQLVLENVCFSYDPSLPVVLNDLSLSIPTGSYTCFLGSSGSGKSTLLSLLMGSRSCTSGRILMDGTDTSTVSLGCLRDSLAVVFQETYVLDGTIFDNIEFGGDCTLEAVVNAAKDAGIHEFIETLPEKYDTLLGSEVNTSLSGGQLQRICGVARALARKPKLLILDEATSALDKVSERLVIKSIEHLRDNGLTIVSVTHHPTTAKNADEIVILDHGRIAQRGRYDALQSQEGHFANLIKAERRKSSIATIPMSVIEDLERYSSPLSGSLTCASLSGSMTNPSQSLVAISEDPEEEHVA